MSLSRILFENKRNISDLVKLIQDEFGHDINDGGCGVFAKLAHELLGYDEFLFVFDSREPDDYPPIHVLVKLGNNKYTDSSGEIYTKADMENQYDYDEVYDEDIDPVVIEGDMNMLDNFYDEMGEGLTCRNYNSEFKKIKNKFKNKF